MWGWEVSTYILTVVPQVVVTSSLKVTGTEVAVHPGTVAVVVGVADPPPSPCLEIALRAPQLLHLDSQAPTCM